MRTLVLVLLAACGGDSSTGDTPDAALPEPDAATIACTELGATWSGGTATCRGADCASYDISACTRADATRWETVEPALRDPRWQTARCNDGTPFDFDVRLAASPSKHWVIYLQGGAFCDDLAHACAARELRLTTTSPRADRAMSALQSGGVTSQSPAVNPGLASANHVRATYCSSDFWAGATTALRPTTAGDWYISGRANVAAMLEILKQRYGLDDAPQTQVLFTGSSAGGFGAHFNASTAIDKLASAKVRLFVDAGWMTDWTDPSFTIGAATVVDLEVWTRARTFWGATFDPACEAANAAEPARCLYGDVWYPHLAPRLPILVNQSSFDAVFTNEHGIPDPPNATATAWRAGVEASMASVAWLFSGDASYHVLSTTDAGLSRGPAGSTLGQVLGRFWADGVPERIEF